MKAFILLLIPISLLTLSSYAQEGVVNLNNLIVPTSPGFVILDKSPASIEKPVSPKTFGVSVLRLLKQNEGGLDFTPYWFWNHPNLTFKNYIDNRSPILQTLNLSLAASQGDSASYLSAGVRTHLLRIFSKDKISDINAIEQDIITALSTDPDNLDLEELTRLKDKLAALTAEPRLSMELAGAMAGFSADNKFAHLANKRYGAWLNVAYRPNDKVPLNLLGVFRYTKAINGSIKSSDSTLIDYGIAASYQQQKFDIQLEYVNRNDVENHEHYNRLALVGNYVVANNVVVVASFGKNFAETENIIALFGVKFGIANEKLSLR